MEGREEADVELDDDEPFRLCGTRGVLGLEVVEEEAGEGELRVELDADGFGEPLFRLRDIELADGTLWPL